MLKKQDPLMASSSSRRESNSKTIGCMSGFFNLLFHHRHRKFLTYGKKQENNKKEEGEVDNERVMKSEGEDERRSEVDRIPVEVEAEMTAAEKRRKLVEALGKCEEDLKALKRMIELVKMNSVINNNDDNNNKEEEEPSPVSVLQSSTTPPHSPFQGTQQQKQKAKRKPGEDEIKSNISLVEIIKRDIEQIKRKPNWISKAMVESVNEVCRDISWGERREIGRIGLALQDFIFKDLIEEFVGDCFTCSMYISLPFDACKRKLHF